MTNETIQDDGDGATTSVKVNGESITVPANGSYRRTTDDGSTKTDIRVDNRNHSASESDGRSVSNHSSSNVRINVQSNGSSE